MKLKTYNTANSASVRKGKPTININLGNGLFSFSNNAREALKLKSGTRIEVHQDEESPKDWYFSITKDKDSGFELRDNSKSKPYLTFNNSHLARLLLSSIELDCNATMLIGTEPVEIEGVGNVYPIITKSASWKQKD
jgi:hypothetical protein